MGDAKPEDEGGKSMGDIGEGGGGGGAELVLREEQFLDPNWLDSEFPLAFPPNELQNEELGLNDISALSSELERFTNVDGAGVGALSLEDLTERDADGGHALEMMEGIPPDPNAFEQHFREFSSGVLDAKIGEQAALETGMNSNGSITAGWNDLTKFGITGSTVASSENCAKCVEISKKLEKSENGRKKLRQAIQQLTEKFEEQNTWRIELEKLKTEFEKEKKKSIEYMEKSKSNLIRANTERLRAESEKKRADEEGIRAEKEKARAEREKKRADRLELSEKISKQKNSLAEKLENKLKDLEMMHSDSIRKEQAKNRTQLIAILDIFRKLSNSLIEFENKMLVFKRKLLSKDFDSFSDANSAEVIASNLNSKSNTDNVFHSDSSLMTSVETEKTKIEQKTLMLQKLFDDLYNETQSSIKPPLLEVDEILPDSDGGVTNGGNCDLDHNTRHEQNEMRQFSEIVIESENFKNRECQPSPNQRQNQFASQECTTVEIQGEDHTKENSSQDKCQNLKENLSEDKILDGEIEKKVRAKTQPLKEANGNISSNKHKKLVKCNRSEKPKLVENKKRKEKPKNFADELEWILLREVDEGEEDEKISDDDNHIKDQAIERRKGKGIDGTKVRKGKRIMENKVVKGSNVQENKEERVRSSTFDHPTNKSNGKRFGETRNNENVKKRKHKETNTERMTFPKSCSNVTSYLDIKECNRTEGIDMGKLETENGNLEIDELEFVTDSQPNDGNDDKSSIQFKIMDDVQKVEHNHEVDAEMDGTNKEKDDKMQKMENEQNHVHPACNECDHAVKDENVKGEGDGCNGHLNDITLGIPDILAHSSENGTLNREAESNPEFISNPEMEAEKEKKQEENIKRKSGEEDEAVDESKGKEIDELIERNREMEFGNGIDETGGEPLSIQGIVNGSRNNNGEKNCSPNKINFRNDSDSNLISNHDVEIILFDFDDCNQEQQIEVKCSGSNNVHKVDAVEWKASENKNYTDKLSIEENENLFNKEQNLKKEEESEKEQETEKEWCVGEFDSHDDYNTEIRNGTQFEGVNNENLIKNKKETPLNSENENELQTSEAVVKGRSENQIVEKENLMEANETLLNLKKENQSETPLTVEIESHTIETDNHSISAIMEKERSENNPTKSQDEKSFEYTEIGKMNDTIVSNEGIPKGKDENTSSIKCNNSINEMWNFVEEMNVNKTKDGKKEKESQTEEKMDGQTDSVAELEINQPKQDHQWKQHREAENEFERSLKRKQLLNEPSNKKIKTIERECLGDMKMGNVKWKQNKSTKNSEGLEKIKKLENFSRKWNQKKRISDDKRKKMLYLLKNYEEHQNEIDLHQILNDVMNFINESDIVPVQPIFPSPPSIPSLVPFPSFSSYDPLSSPAFTPLPPSFPPFSPSSSTPFSYNSSSYFHLSPSPPILPSYSFPPFSPSFLYPPSDTLYPHSTSYRPHPHIHPHPYQPFYDPTKFSSSILSHPSSTNSCMKNPFDGTDCVEKSRVNSHHELEETANHARKSDPRVRPSIPVFQDDPLMGCIDSSVNQGSNKLQNRNQGHPSTFYSSTHQKDLVNPNTHQSKVEVQKQPNAHLLGDIENLYNQVTKESEIVKSRTERKNPSQLPEFHNERKKLDERNGFHNELVKNSLETFILDGSARNQEECVKDKVEKWKLCRNPNFIFEKMFLEDSTTKNSLKDNICNKNSDTISKNEIEMQNLMNLICSVFQEKSLLTEDFNYLKRIFMNEKFFEFARELAVDFPMMNKWHILTSTILEAKKISDFTFISQGSWNTAEDFVYLLGLSLGKFCRHYKNFKEILFISYEKLKQDLETENHALLFSSLSGLFLGYQSCFPLQTDTNVLFTCVQFLLRDIGLDILEQNNNVSFTKNSALRSAFLNFFCTNDTNNVSIQNILQKDEKLLHRIKSLFRCFQWEGNEFFEHRCFSTEFAFSLVKSLFQHSHFPDELKKFSLTQYEKTPATNSKNFESLKALELTSLHLGWEWTHNELIIKTIWPYFSAERDKKYMALQLIRYLSRLVMTTSQETKLPGFDHLENQLQLIGQNLMDPFVSSASPLNN